MIGMVFLAWLFPEFGTAGSPIPLKPITTWGVSLIFFFYGLRLSLSKVISGLTHWRLHLVVQSTTFVAFPLVALIAYWIFGNASYEYWWIGVIYLAVLPSTVSSSVVMVSIAGGNLSAAIFNASISSLIGIILTPLWMSLILQDSSFHVAEMTGVIVDLCVQILLPVVLGMILHRWFAATATKFSAHSRIFDQTIILLIVYRAFSESFEGDMFSGYTSLEILTLSGLMLAFFLLMLVLMQIISSVLKFTREDRIVIVFCGSKKSLVQGAVMGQVLFPQASILGIVLLPLMLYHAIQLLLGSIIAQRMASRS